VTDRTVFPRSDREPSSARELRAGDSIQEDS
jgi:hypothetical protein